MEPSRAVKVEEEEEGATTAAIVVMVTKFAATEQM